MSAADTFRFISAAVRILIRKFIDDRSTTFASALSFSTMFSIVPLLALVFAILKTMGVHSLLEPVILNEVAAGSSEVVNRIIRYIGNTSVTSLGIIGLSILLLSVMATLDSMEEAFNQICGIPRSKAIHHKILDFFLSIVLVPLLIALAVTMTTALQNQAVVLWLLKLPGIGWLLLMLFKVVPYLSIWFALICLYQIIPNTRIRFRNACIGGIAAGTLWQFAQWCYIHLQILFSRNNAIYGALSILPVFMVWLFTSWLIVLAGMQLVWFLEKRNASDGFQSQPGIDDP